MTNDWYILTRRGIWGQLHLKHVKIPIFAELISIWRRTWLALVTKWRHAGHDLRPRHYSRLSKIGGTLDRQLRDFASRDHCTRHEVHGSCTSMSRTSRMPRTGLMRTRPDVDQRLPTNWVILSLSCLHVTRPMRYGFVHCCTSTHATIHSNKFWFKFNGDYYWNVHILIGQLNSTLQNSIFMRRPFAQNHSSEKFNTVFKQHYVHDFVTRNYNGDTKKVLVTGSNGTASSVIGWHNTPHF